MANLHLVLKFNGKEHMLSMGLPPYVRSDDLIRAGTMLAENLAIEQELNGNFPKTELSANAEARETGETGA